MFLFTYPHIRKEKDGIPLIGLTRQWYPILLLPDMWIGKEKQEGVKPVNDIPSFSFLICG
jgi:hypothetical protein